MRKYLTLIGARWKVSFQYRLEVLIWLFIDLVPLLAFFFIWQSVFSNREVVNGYTFSALISYYLLVSLIDRATSSHFEEHRCDEVRLGKIDRVIIKPYSFFTDILTEGIGYKIFSLGIFLPIYAIVTFLLYTQGGVDLISSLNLTHLPVFLIFLSAAFIINFIFSYLIVLATFWMEGANGLKHFKWITVSIFSGMIFPIELVPTWAQRIMQALPFKYLFAVPIGVLQGTYQVTTQDWVYLLGFTLTLTVVTRFIWRQAIKEYTAVGG